MSVKRSSQSLEADTGAVKRPKSIFDVSDEEPRSAEPRSRGPLVFSWAAGPLAMLLDDFPHLNVSSGRAVDSAGLEEISVSDARLVAKIDADADANPHAVMSPGAPLTVSAVAVARATFGGRKGHCPLSASEKEVVDAEIATDAEAHVSAALAVVGDVDPLYFKNLPEGEERDRQVAEAVEEFTLTVETGTGNSNIVDAPGDPRIAEVPFLANNVYGRALRKMRNDSPYYELARLSSGIAVLFLEAAAEKFDPRSIVDGVREGERPYSTVVRLCKARGIKLNRAPAPKHVAAPAGVVIDDDGAMMLEEARWVNVQNFPFVPRDQLIDYVMINRGTARRLFDSVPDLVARRVVEKAGRQLGGKLSREEIDSRVAVVAKIIRDNNFDTRNKLSDLVHTAAIGLWLDAPYWKQCMERPSVNGGDFVVGPDSLISAFHVRKPNYILYGDDTFDSRSASSRGLRCPSVAHAISLVSAMTTFTGRDVESYGNDKAAITELYESVVGGYAASPQQACLNTYARLYDTGVRTLRERQKWGREQIFLKRPWLKSAVDISAKLDAVIAQRTEHDSNEYAGFAGWFASTVQDVVHATSGEEHMRVTPEALQRYSLTKWMVIRRASEIIDLTAAVFPMFLTGHSSGANVARCVAVYCAAMEGAFIPPNAINHRSRPEIFEATMASFRRCAVGCQPFTDISGADPDYADVIRYASGLALEELYAALARQGAETLDKALKSYALEEAVKEEEAYRACTVEDVQTALTNVSKRLAALEIATNYGKPYTAIDVVRVAIMAFTAGCSGAALEGIGELVMALMSTSTVPALRTSGVWTKDVPADVALNHILKDIPSAVHDVAHKIHGRRQMLSCRKIIVWARQPPVALGVFNEYSRNTLEDEDRFFSTPVATDGSLIKMATVDDETVTMLENYFSFSLSSRTRPEPDRLPSSPALLKLTLTKALFEVCKRLVMAARSRGLEFDTVGRLVVAAAPLLLNGAEHLTEMSSIAKSAPISTNELSLEGVRGLCGLLAASMAGLPADRISARRVLNVTLPITSRHTDVIPYRPVEYVAPGVEEFHSASEGPITERDTRPARFILTEEESSGFPHLASPSLFDLSQAYDKVGSYIPMYTETSDAMGFSTYVPT